MGEQTIYGAKVAELSIEEKRQVEQAGLRVAAREKYPQVHDPKPAGRANAYLADADGLLYEPVRIDGMPRTEHGVVASRRRRAVASSGCVGRVSAGRRQSSTSTASVRRAGASARKHRRPMQSESRGCLEAPSPLRS